MARTYTQHKLTEAQLRRLSQIVNGHAHGHGNALDALERKGLVVETIDPHWPHTMDPTDAGREALAQARREGW